MSAVTEGTTVDLEMDGQSTGPIPLDEFEERAKAINFKDTEHKYGGITTERIHTLG